MPISSGTRVGPYEVGDPLGQGGMGEVYRARDTRLDRPVAIKIVKTALTEDSAFQQRFEREARVLSGLNHPHICTVYDVGTHGSAAFIVMELVEGETLASRIDKGRLPVDLAVRYALQIADALAKAHSCGIVHRDLKPANVMLSRSGAKILDFGLAKPAEAQPASGAAAETITAHDRELTAAGALLGTPQYMAPEQLEGQEADARTDLFAFGTLVYEMLSGRRAFEGATIATTIAAILRSEPPPLRSIRRDVPPSLEYLVSACIAKDRGARWASAQDAALLLRAIQERQLASDTAASRPRRGWIPWTVAAGALATALVVGVVSYTRPESTGRIRYVAIVPAPNTTLDLGTAPQISPDGKLVAFVAIESSGQKKLYLRALNNVSPNAVAGTDDAIQPFWSPDSAALGYFANGKLRTVSLSGGPPRTIANAPVPRGGSWSRDGLILFVPSPRAPLHSVSAQGGEATPLATAPPRPCWFPSFLPDGQHFLCAALNDKRRVESIFVASLGSRDTKTLAAATGAGAVAASGHLLYRREGELVAQRFDTNTFELEGVPERLAPVVATHPLTFQTLFSASTEGAVAYLPVGGRSRIVWMDRSGKEMATVGPPSIYNSVCLCRDDARIFVDQAEESGDVDIWMLDGPDGRSSRLTFDATVDFYPICPPHGREVVFGSLRTGLPNLFRQQANAPGSERMFLDSSEPINASQWSADGQFIVYRRLRPATSWDVWVVPISGDRKPFAVVESPYDDTYGGLSPDNRWLTYVSNQTGIGEVYVQRFPDAGARWQISRGGGSEPQWRRNGQELFFLSRDKKLMAVDVTTTNGEIAFGVPRVLFSTGSTSWEGLGTQYAVAQNGQRFLVNRLSSDAASTPITIVLNWTAYGR